MVTSKPSPISVKHAATADSHASTSASSLERAKHAELVTSEPVGGRVVGERRLELRGEPLQQGVAGRMAEGVVVLLEAVEIEEDEDAVLLGVESDCLEIVCELAPVAEPGERIVHRLMRVHVREGSQGCLRLDELVARERPRR